jgi:hypothetical protein
MVSKNVAINIGIASLFTDADVPEVTLFPEKVELLTLFLGDF